MGVERGGRRAIASVRRFRVEDADAVSMIADDSPAAAIWSKESYLNLAEETESLGFVIESDGEVSGFLVGRAIGDQAEILNLAVKAKHRRAGQGTTLLATALRELVLRNVESVYLEVRESNTDAIAFYEKQGFSKTGRRKSYYRQPEEAAVTMVRKLTG